MNKTKICLAVDLGAGSGRVVAGIWDGAKLALDELNRFPNEPVKVDDGWHWNFEGLFGNIKKIAQNLYQNYKQIIIKNNLYNMARNIQRHIFIKILSKIQIKRVIVLNCSVGSLITITNQ